MVKLAVSENTHTATFCLDPMGVQRRGTVKSKICAGGQFHAAIDHLAFRRHLRQAAIPERR
jgi:hypothetical protein